MTHAFTMIINRLVIRRAATVWFAGLVLVSHLWAQTDLTPYGCGFNPPDSLLRLSGSGSLGQTLTLGVNNPLGTQSPGALALLAVASSPDAAFPCGSVLPGFGMAGPQTDGEILVSLIPPSPEIFLGPVVWGGVAAPAAFDLPIPNVLSLAERSIFLQGVLVDPSTGSAVTEGVEIVLAACPGFAETGDEYAVGLRPNEILAVDLNGDRTLDLATVTRTSDDLHVLIGQGDGTFIPQPAYPVGDTPETLTAADLNGDGNLDLAISSDGQLAIDIMFGTPGGLFSGPFRVNLGVRPTAVRSGDLDGDGDVDLAVSIDDGPADADEVRILLNQGDGSFLLQAIHPVGRDPEDLEIADLNGDGILDLITANNDTDDLSILFGTGAAGYLPEQRLPVGEFPRYVIARDVDLDGNLDLIAANSSGQDSASVLLGSGTGLFSSQLVHPLLRSPRQVELADIDLDGHLDLLATPASGSGGIGNPSAPSVSFGRGDGTFGAPQPLSGTGTTPSFVGVGDFDGNGSPDAAFADRNLFAERIIVLLNRCP